jgi:hypothetical protein
MSVIESPAERCRTIAREKREHPLQTVLEAVQAQIDYWTMMEEPDHAKRLRVLVRNPLRAYIDEGQA